jgi:dUTP pyrophosphatase
MSKSNQNLPKVRIKRIDKTLPLPIYETNGSIGFDLLARTNITIQPGEIKRIPANVVVETPLGYLLMLASRSSTPVKKGLTKPHGVGVIDQDYSGEEDELLIQVYNFTDQPTTVSKGEKVAQGVFIKADRLEFEEVEQMNKKNRGGFGSTS